MVHKAALEQAASKFEQELEWMARLGHGEATNSSESVPPGAVACQDVRKHFEELNKAFLTIKRAGPGAKVIVEGTRLDTGRIKKLEVGMTAMSRQVEAMPKKGGFYRPDQQIDRFEAPVAALEKAFQSSHRTDYGTFEV
jgi:hypothetical protein